MNVQVSDTATQERYRDIFYSMNILFNVHCCCIVGSTLLSARTDNLLPTEYYIPSGLHSSYLRSPYYKL